MAIFNMTELRARLAPGQRLIGLDPGARIVGVALSDAGLVLASPHQQLPRKPLAALAVALRQLAWAEGAGGLVVGLPLSMDGSVGPAAQAARDFAHAVSGASGLPAAMWDERLSSAAVNRMLLAQDATRRQRAERVDRMAAAYILQSALDASRGA